MRVVRVETDYSLRGAYHCPVCGQALKCEGEPPRTGDVTLHRYCRSFLVFLLRGMKQMAQPEFHALPVAAQFDLLDSLRPKA